VVVVKYTSSQTDRQTDSGYCSPDLPDFAQLVEEGDDRLFRKIINNPSHVLYGLLPPPTTAKQQYNLRRRPHARTHGTLGR